MASINDRGFSTLAEVLSERGLDGLGNAVEILINEAMRIAITDIKYA